MTHVTSDRDSSNTRIVELETKVSILEREVAAAKREVVAALTRAEKAELKEQAVSKQEEERTPRVQALVNSLTGKNLCLPFSLQFPGIYHK